MRKGQRPGSCGHSAKFVYLGFSFVDRAGSGVVYCKRIGISNKERKFLTRSGAGFSMAASESLSWCRYAA